MESWYAFILRNITGSTREEHIEGCRRLVELFEARYKANFLSYKLLKRIDDKMIRFK
jgi:hypothetical protein